MTQKPTTSATCIADGCTNASEWSWQRGDAELGDGFWYATICEPCRDRMRVMREHWNARTPTTWPPSGDDALIIRWDMS